MDTARGDRVLRGLDLLERPAEVHRRRPADSLVAPGIGPSRTRSSLNAAGAVAIAPQLRAVPRAQASAGHFEDASRRQVEDRHAVPVELAQVAHALAGDDLAAELPKHGRQRVGDPLRASPWEWPADGVAGDQQRLAQTAGQRGPQREE